MKRKRLLQRLRSKWRRGSARNALEALGVGYELPTRRPFLESSSSPSRWRTRRSSASMEPLSTLDREGRVSGRGCRPPCVHSRKPGLRTTQNRLARVRRRFFFANPDPRHRLRRAAWCQLVMPVAQWRRNGQVSSLPNARSQTLPLSMLPRCFSAPSPRPEHVA